jgi:hypothetical protein
MGPVFLCFFNLCRDCKPLNGDSPLKHSNIGLDAPAVTGETYLHFRRIAVGFPESAAGKVPALVFNKADHIPEGIS